MTDTLVQEIAHIIYDYRRRGSGLEKTCNEVIQAVRSHGAAITSASNVTKLTEDNISQLLYRSGDMLLVAANGRLPFYRFCSHSYLAAESTMRDVPWVLNGDSFGSSAAYVGNLLSAGYEVYLVRE